MPQYFAEALVATEDHRFYTDPGVDPLALVRVTASWLTGHTDGGGSTLDQQLAKNLYTSGSSSFPQIVEQVVVAVKLDQAYSRAELLRLYAEIAYYGHGYYGLAGSQLRLLRAAARPAHRRAGRHAGRRGERTDLRRPADLPGPGPGPAGARHRPDGRGRAT